MDETATTTGLVEAMENASQPVSEPASARRLRVLGRPDRRDQQGLLAFIGFAAPTPGVEQRLLAGTWSRELPTALQTSSYLTEPPDADPHVRWCGRGAVRPSPYPDYSWQIGHAKQGTAVRFTLEEHWHAVAVTERALLGRYSSALPHPAPAIPGDWENDLQDIT